MRSKKKRIIIICILLFLVALLGSGIFVVKHYLGKINRVDDSNVENVIPPERQDFEVDSNSSGELPEDTMDPDEVQWDDVQAFQDDHLINILLVGQDRWKGQGRQRSDTMILCSINPETKQISMISFLRDLYVQIPNGYADNRLNAAYAFGGFPLLNQTIQKNFGITIDGNFEVDFEGFKQVIDILGGVDIELTSAEAQYLGEWANVGWNHFDGKQALEYARIRKIDSDFNRTARQRIILETVFNEVKQLSFTEAMSLMDTILPCLTTNMTDTEILSLATKLFPIMSSVELQSHSVPASDAYTSARIRGMAVLVPDLDLIREQLQNEYLPVEH